LKAGFRREDERKIKQVYLDSSLRPSGIPLMNEGTGSPAGGEGRVRKVGREAASHEIGR